MVDSASAFDDVVADHPHQVHAAERRAEQRGMGAVGEIEQALRNLGFACHDQAQRFALFQLCQREGQFGGRKRVQIIQFGAAQYLHPVRVDQVHVADQALVGSVDDLAVEYAIGTIRAAYPSQPKTFLLVVE